MEGRVLVIEDHEGTRALIKRRLEEEGLQVAEADTGVSGTREAIRSIPQVILVSTTLPDMPGLEIVRRLRKTNRTKHIFLMMIADEENRNERLQGLDAGANDFLTLPIDPDLVMLRVRNAINRANLDNHTDPVTGMPAGRRLQDEMSRLLRAPQANWALMHVRVRHLKPFREVYGFVAGDELLRGTARILAEELAQDDIEEDFLGYGGRDDFIVITLQARAKALAAEVSAQFDHEIGTYYGFLDRQQGYIESGGVTYPLASLRIDTVTPDDGPFYDIRSLSEALAG